MLCTDECTQAKGHSRECQRFTWEDERALRRYPDDPEHPQNRGAARAAPAAAPALAGAGVGVGPQGVFSGPPREPERVSALGGFAVKVASKESVEIEIECRFAFQNATLVLYDPAENFVVERVTLSGADQILSPIPGQAFREGQDRVLLPAVKVGDKLGLRVQNRASLPLDLSLAILGVRVRE